MNTPSPKDVLEGLERGAAILRVLGPIAEQVEGYIFGDGPEPAIFEQLPELKSPAALERAKAAAANRT